jgi:hypothetical protein
MSHDAAKSEMTALPNLGRKIGIAGSRRQTSTSSAPTLMRSGDFAISSSCDETRCKTR